MAWTSKRMIDVAAWAQDYDFRDRNPLFATCCSLRNKFFLFIKIAITKQFGERICFLHSKCLRLLGGYSYIIRSDSIFIKRIYIGTNGRPLAWSWARAYVGPSGFWRRMSTVILVQKEVFWKCFLTDFFLKNYCTINQRCVEGMRRLSDIAFIFNLCLNPVIYCYSGIAQSNRRKKASFFCVLHH